METGQSYETTIGTYTAQLRDLFANAESNEAVTTDASQLIGAQPVGVRGGTTQTVELIAERAERLPHTLQQVGELTSRYLETGTQLEQEAAELKLLAQVEAQVELARGLLLIGEKERHGRATAPATRATGVDLQGSLDKLAAVLETPMEAMLPTPLTRSIEDRPKEPAAASADLQREVGSALRMICRQAASTSRQAAQTLAFLDPGALKQGVSLISKDAAEMVDKIAAGLTQLVRRLVTAAMRLLLQAYEWVMDLLGKEVEQKAREKIAEWRDELKKDQPAEDVGWVDRLVERLYTRAVIEKEVTAWLATSEASVEAINQAAETVAELSRKYEAKSDRVTSVLKVVGLTRVVPLPVTKTPQFQVVVAAISFGLLGYTLYTGYDHIDSGRITFSQRFGFNIPDHVAGIRETVQQALGIPEAGTQAIASE